MAGDPTGDDKPSDRHAAELERLSRQLSGLRPKAKPPAVRAGSVGEGVAAHRGRADELGPRRRSAGRPVESAQPHDGRLATVLPFRRPGLEEPAEDGQVDRPRRAGGRRQSPAERQERKTAARAADAAAFAERLEADPEEAARELCLSWLAVRPHTRAELAAKLKRKGVPTEAVAVVLDRYGEVGLIDDAAFAAAWVQSRHVGRGLARRALAYELRARGIDGATVEAAVNQLEPADEEAKARALVTRKLASMGHVPEEARARRLMGMLARKGYPGGMAATVVREVIAGSGEDLADPELD